MSFYQMKGLVRFPGLGGLVRFPGLAGFRGFGDLAEAQDAVGVAQGKITAAQAKVANQKKLVAYTEKALKNCVEDGGSIVGNILSGGVSAAICIADQQNQLGQRRGILVQFEAELESAKAELKTAQAMLVQAKSQAAEAAAREAAGLPPIVSTGAGSSGSASTSSDYLSGSSSFMDTKIMGMSPIVLAAIAVPVLGAVVYAMSRKRSSVAGYRRRSRR